MKKLLKLLLLTMSLSLVCGFTACKEENPSTSESPSSSVEQTEDTFVVSPKTTNLVIGETQKITVEYKPEGDTQLAFVSANPEVATVSADGTITAVKEGSTTVSVTYGENSVSVSVTVTTGNFLPSLNLSATTGSSVQVDVKDRLNLKGTVLFNGKEYADATFSYTVQDPTMATVTDGMLQPLKTGTTNVTITAAWRGFTNVELTKTIALTIIENHVVVINDNAESITLYTSSPEGQSMSEVLTATVDDVVSAQVVFSVLSGADFVTLSGTTVSSVKAGTAVIRATYTSNGQNFVDDIEINVVRPTIQYATTVKYFSAVDGDSYQAGANSLSQILATEFGSETITDATQTVTVEGELTQVPLTVETGNLIKGVQADVVKDDDGYVTGINPVTITVNSDKRGITFTLEAYTKVIKDKAGLEYFNVSFNRGTASASCGVDGCTQTGTHYHANENSNRYDGYYILANNIDLEGAQLSNTHTSYLDSFGAAGQTIYYTEGEAIKNHNSNENYGLLGTFDGNGYTVKNAKMPKGGLFGLIGKNGTVKNLAITGATFTNNYQDATLAVRIFDGANLSNLYIQAANLGGSSTTGTLVAKSIRTGATIENCVFAVDNAATQTEAHGVLFREGAPSADVTVWKNVFVISPVLLYKNKAGTTIIDGANQTGATLTLSGVKRYENSNAMIADKTANETSLATFDSKFWDTSSGVPVWKTAN